MKNMQINCRQMQDCVRKIIASMVVQNLNGKHCVLRLGSHRAANRCVSARRSAIKVSTATALAFCAEKQLGCGKDNVHSRLLLVILPPALLFLELELLL